MHGAAQSAIESGLAREDFAVGSVGEKAARQVFHRSFEVLLHRTEQRAVAIGLHDLEQALVGDLPDGGEAFGEYFAMAAMGAKDVVFRSQQEGHAHGGGFLAD